ncbi:MAG: hypothetical protein FJ405_20020, partial [Verrucomicrobia bacterium]|nr:hypothetical protein [Verrucomicrobiota bacterium]
MAQSPLDVWTAIVSQATPTTLEKLSKFVDFAEPPEFFDYAQTQWNLQQQRNPDSTWELLVDGQLIFSAVGHPSVLNLKEATVLARIAMTGDPLFTTKLLRRLLANRIWPEEVPADEMLRALSILEALEDPQRLAMTLLKFSKFPCRMVQSKVAKLLGRVSDSIDVLEELFQVPDARVRANLLQGIAQRDDLEPFRAMIDRGCKDQNTRVSAFALAIKARTGHGGSKALLKMRLNAKTGDVRDVAHFASSIVGLADLVGGAEPA